MGRVIMGLFVAIESGVTWIALWMLWRRNAEIRRKLSEPRLVHDEFLRRLAESNAAAKAVLDVCPQTDLPSPYAQRRKLLTIAVAAVEEFAS